MDQTSNMIGRETANQNPIKLLSQVWIEMNNMIREFLDREILEHSRDRLKCFNKWLPRKTGIMCMGAVEPLPPLHPVVALVVPDSVVSDHHLVQP